MKLKKILTDLSVFMEKANKTPTDDLIKIIPSKEDAEELFRLAGQIRGLHSVYEGHQLSKKYSKGGCRNSIKKEA